MLVRGVIISRPIELALRIDVDLIPSTGDWTASNHSMSRLPHVWKKAVMREPPATTLSAAAQERATATVQSSNAVKKPPPRELRRLAPISGGGGDRADRRRSNGASATAGTELAERAAKAWMRHALAKRVATRLLKRSTAPPAAAVADEGSSPKKVIACCCARLPPGLRCALHQYGAPGRAWMRAQRRGCNGGAAVAPPKAHGWAFSEYARWRRHVWMPSRFYLERVEAEEHRAAAERLRLVRRL
ncbi:unnamed protein product [Miscanthus lutarioriparius]|uniref:Uncharacterized protein n=1 Tax=Miscanthus lutarioriparius TaxID=422564 RepID=A0A811S9J7_9POAL|nr:unnamed protein product [Miscanthus lutarioriparius]